MWFPTHLPSISKKNPYIFRSKRCSAIVNTQNNASQRFTHGLMLYDLHTAQNCWLLPTLYDYWPYQHTIYLLPVSVKATMSENNSRAKRYTPNSPTAKDAAHALRYGLKGILLYLLPFPALIAGIVSLVRGDIGGTLVTGGAFAAYMLCEKPSILDFVCHLPLRSRMHNHFEIQMCSKIDVTSS